jgi:hypothetical protein
VLNSIKRPNYTLYALQDENMAYFVDGTYMGDHFGPARYTRLWDKLTDGEPLYNELKSMNADYFLVNPSRMKIALAKDSFFQSHFKQLYSDGNINLFELTDVPFQRKVENLFQNPGFEELKDKQVTGWNLAGGTIVDSSGKESFTGKTSVLCSRSGGVIYQRLPINTGGRYFFTGEARGVQQPGTVKLQANWYDNQGHLLQELIKVFEVGVDWTHCETNIESPTNATSVIVYISPLDPGSAWFDDLSFGTMTYAPLP